MNKKKENLPRSILCFRFVMVIKKRRSFIVSMKEGLHFCLKVLTPKIWHFYVTFRKEASDKDHSIIVANNLDQAINSLLLPTQWWYLHLYICINFLPWCVWCLAFLTLQCFITLIASEATSLHCYWLWLRCSREAETSKKSTITKISSISFFYENN